jgi:membrane protease YdiL (CAAX protease family)
MFSAITVRRSVALELCAIALLTVAFLVVFRVRPSYVDFALAGLAVALIAASAGRSRRLWQSLPPLAGTRAGFRGAAIETAIFTAAALVALAIIAVLAAPAELTREQLVARFVSWHWLIAMLVYFAWALLQQFIFQFYLFGRLVQLVPAPLAIALTGLAFSSVHFPRWPVMALTAIAGAYWAFVYYRHRALVPLAISHAILGAALHYWVFGRDLLAIWPAL